MAKIAIANNDFFKYTLVSISNSPQKTCFQVDISTSPQQSSLEKFRNAPPAGAATDTGKILCKKKLDSYGFDLSERGKCALRQNQPDTALDRDESKFAMARGPS